MIRIDLAPVVVPVSVYYYCAVVVAERLILCVFFYVFLYCLAFLCLSGDTFVSCHNSC